MILNNRHGQTRTMIDEIIDAKQKQTKVKVKYKAKNAKYC